MYKEVLRTLADVDVFGIISLLLFVLFFTALLIQVMTMSKGFINKMSDLPLDDQTIQVPKKKTKISAKPEGFRPKV